MQKIRVISIPRRRIFKVIALALAAVLPVLCVPAVTVLAENIGAVTVVIDADTAERTAA